VARALEAGITYFDTAPSYGDGASERNLGSALRELGATRRVVVGTKVRLSAADLDRPAAAVRRSIEESLARLRLNHVDVLHLHNPLGVETPNAADPGLAEAAVLDEIAGALLRTVEDGLAGHAGFTAVGATEVLHRVAAHAAYETAQVYVNVLNPSAVRPGASGGQQDFDGLAVRAAEHGTGVIAIRVYAAGALSGVPERHPIAFLPHRPLIPGSAYAEDVKRARALADVARERDMDGVLELGLRFALTAPAVSTALVGLSSVEHLESAIRWAERGPLPDDLIDLVLERAAPA
jgi:aryl-alcohol dehydrogenase-like predicted oxidoreductase